MTILTELEDAIHSCQRCHLHQTRKNAVPGEGNPDAAIMFIGEAPGSREDQTGRPFVGRAGTVLDQALESADVKRDEVYITNVVKCRPPDNRNPTRHEIETCTPFLDEQISRIAPSVICTLGTFAAGYVLSAYGFAAGPLSAIHGTVYRSPLAMLNIVPLYHPAAALYNPGLREVIQSDMHRVASLLDATGKTRRDAP
ncbi:MAG: uracil-DNA glycosylase [Thermoplasmatota archaeon]